MGFGRGRFSRRRLGISEVLGALLLIIVVVAAVASLAYFVAETEKAAQARSTYLTSVANENLQVPYAQFSPGSPSIQWELNNAGNGTLEYYVQVVSANELMLKQAGSSGPLITISKMLNGTKNASSVFIHDGAFAQVKRTSETINFAKTGYNFTFGPATWSILTINILNENTQVSSLEQIRINNNWLPSWEEVDQTSHTLIGTFGSRVSLPNGTIIATPPLNIPAKGSVNLNLSLAELSIPKNDSIKLTLLTVAGNFFTTTYSPPVPVILSSAASENYQIVTRDIVTFDGSHSVASGGAAEAYLWEFEVPTITSNCSVSSFANPANLDVGFATGETVQYFPESIFSPTQLQNDCITGPIMAFLTVVDDNGLMTTSQPVMIASDPNIAPIGSISGKVTSQGPDTDLVTITVTDIFGRPVTGAVVTAITYAGDAVTNSTAYTTWSNGHAYFSVSWTTTGSIQFTVGALPPLRESFP